MKLARKCRAFKSSIKNDEQEGTGVVVVFGVLATYALKMAIWMAAAAAVGS